MEKNKLKWKIEIKMKNKKENKINTIPRRWYKR
jgi:hypothetical protein